MKTNKAEFLARVAYLIGKYNFGYNLKENTRTGQLNFLNVNDANYDCGFYFNGNNIQFYIDDRKGIRLIYSGNNDEEECLRMLEYALVFNFDDFLNLYPEYTDTIFKKIW